MELAPEAPLRFASLDFEWIGRVAKLEVIPQVADEKGDAAVTAPLFDVRPLVAENRLAETRLPCQHVRPQRDRDVAFWQQPSSKARFVVNDHTSVYRASRRRATRTSKA